MAAETKLKEAEKKKAEDQLKAAMPKFLQPASPARLKPAIEAAKKAPIGHVDAGEFGADMQVALVNDGPVTIPLNTENL